MPKLKSPFLTWFKLQYGKLPMSEANYYKMQEEWNVLKNKAEDLELKIRVERILRAELGAALTAWNAKPESKSKFAT